MAPKAAPKAGQAPARSTPQPAEVAGGDQGDELGGDDYDMPVIVKVKPDDQLDLSPEELEKEVPPRVLYPMNPRAPHNTTQFSFKEKAFKIDEQVDQVVMHFSMDGQILLKDSPDAQEQIEIEDKKEQEQLAREQEEAIEEDFDPPENDKEIPQKNPLRNQFNFSERAAQTKNPLLRERAWTTEPPPTTAFRDTVTQWAIYDQYMADIEASKEKEKDDKEKKKTYDDPDKKKKSDADPTYSEAMKLSIKIMERMVNQNAENEVYHDFKYWEDRSDEFRDGEGTLLPLWRFSSEKAKKKQVTCIKWNPKYNDLCAVGFGSYDFMRQGTGVICCYSLKNTRFPEYVFNTDAGVCCVDWHPNHPAVLAVGLYDGTVLVYDVRARTKKPIYQSTVRTNKHTDPVWEVRWNTDESTGTLNFFSISSDGRVSNWFLRKNKLESEEVMELKLMSSAAGGSGDDDETSLAGLAGLLDLPARVGLLDLPARVGVMGEFAAEAWVQDVASVDANMLGFSWGEEPLGAVPYDGHWHQESLAGSETTLGGQTFWPEVPEDDSWAWQAEAGVFPGQEFLITQSSSTWAGKDATFGMPTDGSVAANRQTMWGVARCFAPWGEEASEGIRGAWTETATTAASSRSAASAADSASDIDHANLDDDAEEAEELLASCWKVVTQV